MDFYHPALAIQDETVAFRRYLHQHPEPSGAEENTARAVAWELEACGISCERLPCNAVIARIEGGRPGKTVALRADIDALMVEDQCGKPYQSQNPGVCHACGHDFHAAALLSALKLLNGVKDQLRGQVLGIFQHSEERPPSGAQELVERYGIMDGVDGIFGIHVINKLNAGDVSVQAGPRLAGSMNVYVDIVGKGGHGAMPQDCIDPILASAATIQNLQSIVSREISPIDGVSLTVGKIQGGTTHHSVANEVHFEAAIKCLNAGLREQIKSSVLRIVQSTAETFRCTARIQCTQFGVPLVNDRRLSAMAEKSAAEQLGPQHVVQCDPWPVSEDFTKYLEKVPGVFALVGGRNEQEGLTLQNHHPAFDVDESALASAAALYAGFAFDFLASDG